MRILWVATKAPVPAADGGRLVARTTIDALAAAGHDVTVVAPVAPGAHAAIATAAAHAGLRVELVDATPAPWSRALLRAAAGGLPVTIARHTHEAMRARVDALLAATRFDVVHAEQVHAVAACAPAAARGVSVVLRAQNVESDLWGSGGVLRRLEGRRLARFEGAAVRRVAAAVALTGPDAERLMRLAGGSARVHRIAAPFPADGLAAGRALAGNPAVVLPGSAGWAPNDDAAKWFVGDVWPAVRARLPGAELHCFAPRPRAPAAASARGVTMHPTPSESRALFPERAIVVVPLRRALGVRMRILEAWVRGVPVVATSAAAVGLDDGAARALALADGAEAIAAAIARLADDGAARAALVAAGRAFLRTHHDPATIAAALARVYAETASNPPQRAPLDHLYARFPAAK